MPVELEVRQRVQVVRESLRGIKCRLHVSQIQASSTVLTMLIDSFLLQSGQTAKHLGMFFLNVLIHLSHLVDELWRDRACLLVSIEDLE